MRLFWWRRKREDELEEEIQAHLRMAIAERMERGETREQAEAAARREFGNVLLVKDVTRDSWGWTWLEQLLQDIRYALRQMRRSPGFTAVAVLTLALGIGANTAIFTLVNSVVLRSLPVPNPQQLVLVQLTRKAGANTVYSYPFYKKLAERNQVLSGLLTRIGSTVYVGDDASSDPIEIEAVSGNYFSVLGVGAAIGRVLTPDDELPAGEPACVVSYGLWHRRFAADAHIVGKTIRLKGHPFTIAGVTPRAFTGSEPGRVRDIRIPITMIGYLHTGNASQRGMLDEPTASWLEVIGRLKPGISRKQARASLQLTIDQLDRDQKMQGAWAGTVDLLPANQGYGGLRTLLGRPLLLMMAAVILVLLIACANLANLLLARASSRGREMAVRLALGAGRARLARQLFTESVLLALAGGLAGLLVSSWVPRALLRFAPRRFPFELDVSFDWHVFGFAFAASVLVGLLFGLGPALSSAKLSLNAALKQAAAAGAVRLPMRKLLVVVQVALSLVLVMGAALLVRSLRNLQTYFPGFAREDLLLVNVRSGLPGVIRPPTPAATQNFTFFDQLIERVQAMPGVRSVSFANVVPLSGDSASQDFIPEGYERKPGEDLEIWTNRISPNYFATMGTPLLAGRDFTRSDLGSAARVAIVNQTAARRFWPGRNPIGSHIVSKWGGDPKTDKWATQIVGVVADTKYKSLREAPRPILYRPILPGPSTLHVRVAGDVRPIVTALLPYLRSVGAPTPVSAVTTLETITADSLAVDRLMATLSACFGLLALMLAAVGLYGAMAYAVSRRTAEIGVRMALGAKQRDVLGMVLRESLVLAVAGVAIGVAGGLAAGRLLASFLFGLSWRDPASTACAVIVLLGAATLAAYLPARRAAKVDPLVALRQE